MTANDILHAIADLILAREASNNKIVRAGHLEQAVYFMALILRIYCKQQGKNCEHCVFRLEDPDRKSCECKINIGKNESGTAPRFWELVEKREADEKTQNPCSLECPDRKPGCHSKRCPHGWGEYEKRYQEYILRQQQEKKAIQEADAYKQERIRKKLRTKRGGKYLPIR